MAILEILLYAFFAFVICYLIYRVVKHGGVSAGMYGAKIRETVGELSSETVDPIRVDFKVHRLEENSNNKAIGLEVAAKNLGSIQKLYLPLSKNDVEKLIPLLKKAIEDKTA